MRERDWERERDRERLRGERETAGARKTTMGRKTALAREMEEQTNLSDLGQQLHIFGNISSISSQVTDTLHSAKYHT